MKKTRKIEIIWDGDGWYFRSGDREGIAPGQTSLTSTARDELESEARTWATWEGLVIDDSTTFEITEV